MFVKFWIYENLDFLHTNSNNKKIYIAKDANTRKIRI